KQYVQLTGLGHPLFEGMAKKLEGVRALFQDKMGSMVVQAWTPCHYDGHVALDMHSRYFTQWQDDPTGVHVGFEDTVDPMHVLEDARGADYICTQDNQVQYCRKDRQSKAGRR
ncbi:hypothetical protein BJ165DRAFT_1340628, partial [Panaeolus papilionaceus]